MAKSTSSAPRPAPKPPATPKPAGIVHQGSIKHPTVQGSTTYGRPGPKSR